MVEEDLSAFAKQIDQSKEKKKKTVPVHYSCTRRNTLYRKYTISVLMSEPVRAGFHCICVSFKSVFVYRLSN